MAAAYCLKNAVGKGLRIDADSFCAAVSDNLKLFIINTVRSSRFNSIFAVFGNIKIIRNGSCKLFEKRRRKRSRRSSAEIYAFKLQRKLFCNFSGFLKLPAKQFYIGLHELFCALVGVGNKGTITAPCWAKRN